MAQTRPEDMRQAMADYVKAVHRAYLSQAEHLPPGISGRMPLFAAGDFTVVAAGVQNLHVVATTEPLAPPRGPEVAHDDRLGALVWSVRFYDPVVLPALGLIDEGQGPAGDRVRRALGLATYLYHLVVQPGGQLTDHHATHAGAGLANAHGAAARDFEAIRAHAGGRERLVDEMEGAAIAGLGRAQVLLASEIVPWDETVQRLAAAPTAAAADVVRRAVLEAVRRRDDGR